MAVLLWLIGGIVLIAAEMLSGDFFLFLVGMGALCGGVAELIAGNVWLSVAVFAVSSVGLVTFARPWLRARFHPAMVHDNVKALIGGKATVLSTVDEHGGQVKLNGEVWSARTFGESQVIETGTAVRVIDIAGATAIVSTDTI